MSFEKMVNPEFYPTDIRFVDSFFNIAIESNLLKEVLLANSSKLGTYGLSVTESLTILNWIVRRILKELDIHVQDYELDSNLEEFYDDVIKAEERDYLLGVVNTHLKKQDFKPTMVQAMVTGERIFLSFGATNVHNFNSPKPKPKSK